MMKVKKNIFLSLTLALMAEIILIYIIYFNDYKIEPIMPSELQISINGTLNFLSAMSLFIAYKFIKRAKIKMHIIFILIAMCFSALFLINYIIYHLSAGHTVFQHEYLRPYYLFILITHLLSSIICLPLVFTTFSLGVFKHLSTHKRLAPLTFKLWMYVSISGVALVLFLKFFHGIK
jgi:putative membrane protein